MDAEPAHSPTGPELAILIVNYDGWPDVDRLVAGLAAAPGVASGRAEVVVVDNDSPGPIPDAFRADRRGVRLVERPDNGGFAVAVNAGWRAAPAARWLLLLNPDVVAPPDLPGRVLDRVAEYESRGPAGRPSIVGFGLRDGDEAAQPSVGAEIGLARCVREAFIPRSRRKYQADRATKPGPAPWVTGACMLVDAAAMRAAGGMDEEFFLYYEEAALCRVARRLGLRVEFDPSVSVVHLRPLQGRGLAPRMRVVTRHSKLLYFRKHRPRWEFLALSTFVAAEARLRRLASLLRGDAESARSWGAIGSVAATLRAGGTIRGREILAVADGIGVGEVGGPRPVGGAAGARSRRPTRT